MLATNDPEPTSTTVDLTDTATIESVVQTTATTSGLDEGTVDSTNVTTLITASNTKVEETVAESPDGAALLTGVSEVSQVTQSETTEAVSDGEVSTEDLDNYTEEGLDQQVTEAVTGDVDGTTDPLSEDEILIGTSGDDVIDGGLGNDTISGAAGADELIGGEGDDTVSGGTGEDVLIAGTGNNTYDGGADFDVLDYSSSAAGLTIDLDSGIASNNGFAGTDTVTNIERIVGTSGDDVFYGAVDQSTLERFRPGDGTDFIDGRGGNDAVDYRDADAGNGTGVTVDLGANGDANGAAIDPWGNTDTLLNLSRAFGSEFGDNIIGDGQDNVLFGSGGNDTLVDGGGNDALFGETGSDTFRISGAGADYIGDFERGSDKIDLSALPSFIGPTYLQFLLSNQDPGDNGTFIDFGDGNSLYVDGLALGEELTLDDFILPTSAAGLNLTGDEFDNVLVGDTGDDTISAGLGSDTLEGGAGNDTLTVANPDEPFSESNIFISGQGNDDYQGAVNAFDTLDFSGAPNSVTVDLEAGTASDGFGGTDTLSNINKIIGSSEGDTLLGSEGSTLERFVGGAGNDTIDGRGGDNDGVDYRDTDNGNGVQVDLGFYGEAHGRANDPFGGVDEIFNVERAYGTAYNDSIWGDNLDNRFISAGGVDFIDGRDGDDWLFNNGDEDQGLVIDLARDLSPEGSFNVDNNGYGESGGTIINVEGIFGTDFDDVIYANAEANLLVGGRGADTLSGGEGNDTILAGFLDDAGDTLIDGAGADYLEGGVGADTFIIEGFSGVDESDTIGDFEQGIDIIDLTQAPTFLSAQQLQAQLDQQAQSDIDNGFDGGTYLQLGSDSNLWIGHDDNVSQLTLADFVLNDPGTGIEITGTTGNDTYIDDNNDTSLRGTEADDTINGLDGDDNIEGFGGDDILNGDAGNDNISAGAGSDQINGGAGQDNVNYDSWQFLASRGVQVNLTDTNVDVGDAILLQGEARDPDGGIDELDSIENFNGTQYDDQYWVGSIADTNISADPNDPNYFGVGISGGLGNDSVYQEWDSDVRVFFAPGLSNIGFEGDDGTAGDYFFTNGSGHLEFGDLPNYPGNEGQGVSVGFAYAELDEFGNVVSQQLNQADGPGMRTFFDDGVDYLGLTENSDSVFGNNTATTYFDLRAGADEAYTGGADRGINMGDDGSGGDGAADVVYHQGGNINIDSFELGLDQVDFTQFPTFISSDLLQAQLDQMIVDGQGEIYFDFGQFGSLYLPINPSDFVIADNFILNDPGPGVELDGTAGNDTYIDDNNDTSLRGTEGDDIINGLAGDDNIDGFGGSDVLNGDEGDDNISAGAGNDTINGGAGLDNVNYDSWQFISQRGVTINLGSGQWWDDTQAGEARDPDGGIDELTGIESVSGSQFGDAVHVGNGADTGMEIPSFADSYYFSFNGQSGNDYLESVGDVYVNFSPGESELFFDEFGNDLDTGAGDYFNGNGTGNLNMSEGQFNDQDSGIQIYFGFEGQEGRAHGPNVRVFFNGITDANGGKNNDELRGNELDNALRGEGGDDTLVDGAGADYLEGGAGADRFVIQGFSGPGLQDTIGDFEQSLDKIDLTQAPVFVTAAQLQAQLDANLQSDTDNGFDGGTYLQLGSESNLWISHDDNVSQLTLADFVLNDAGTGIEITGTTGNDTYIDDNNDTSLRGTEADDTINGLDGDDNIEGFGGDDILNGDAGNDNISAGAGSDQINGGAGQDNVNYDSWQFLASRGVQVNLTDTNVDVGDAILLQGEARDPDGGIDELDSIENFNGTQYDDQYWVGSIADTNISADPNDPNYFGVGISGGLGNDSVYQEWDSDVRVFFAPGLSNIGFEGDDGTAGDYFFTNGSGHLEFGDLPNYPGNEGQGVSVGFAYAELDEFGNVVSQQLNQADGPGMRTFFDDGVDYLGLTENSDSVFGNNTATTYFDLRAGADEAYTGGADRGINMGDDGSGGDGAADVVYHQGGNINIDSFELGLDQVDFTQFPTFISSDLLQAQLDQMIVDGQGEIYFDFGQFGSLYLPINPSDFVIADNFILNDPGPGVELDGTAGNDTYIDDNNDTSLRGTEGDDIINGLAGDDNIDGFGGSDVLNGDEGDDNISAGAGNDTINGGAGLDNVNYDSWQFISQRGVTINLGSGQWWDDTQAGEARDPDGGIDELTGIESVSGSQFGDAVHVGNGADTGMEIPSFADSYYFSFNGQSGNDYLESVGDVYVNFSPGESELFFDEFGNDLDTGAGDYFNGNGTGNLNMSEGQFNDQDSGIQIYFGFEGQEGRAHGPNVRVFFNGITDANGGKNNDELRGNELDNALRGEGGDDTLVDGAGADYLEGGAGADRFVIQGFSGPGLQDTIGDFEQSLDKIDLTQAPVFVTAAQLQAQLDANLQSDTDNGFDGGTYLQLGSESNLWISHDDNVSQLTLADFVLNDAGTGIEITGTTGNDTYIDDNNDTSLRGTEADDTINGLDGDDNIEGFGGDDILNGDAGNDNISAGAGSDQINGGAGQDNVNYDSWQFLASRGVQVNLTDTNVDVGDAILLQGEARDPDGGIDELDSIENFNGTQYDDQYWVGSIADTNISADPNDPNYFGVGISGGLGNDSVYQEWDSDVRVFFAPGLSNIGFEGDDGTAGDYFFTNGSGHLEFGDLPNYPGNEGQGVSVGFAYAELDEFGNVVSQQLNQADGPGMRTFFDDGVDYLGLTENSDSVFGNNTATTYFDLRAGADEAYTGGADRGINMGDDGSGGDGAADVVYHQGGNINIDSFELGLDQVDFTQFPTFISSDLLQAQLDQMIVDGQGEIYFDFGQFGSLYLPINPSDFVIADNFILNDPGPGVELDGTAGNDTYIDDNNDTSLRGTEGDDIINGLAGDDNIDGFGGSDVLNGDEGDDNISAGAGNDTINGGAGLDNVNYDSWQFISQRGVTINLGSGQWWDDTQAGEARDPDGGIDELTGIESVSGSQFGDAVHVGNGADTGMEIPSFADSYYFSFNGQSGNDYLESVGDVYVNFSPGESELFFDEFGNDLDTGAGDYFNGNGTGNLNMSEGQFNDQDSGIQIYFGFEGQEGRAHGPNVRVFFNGITDANGGKNNDELRGNELDNALRGEGGDDTLVDGAGADYLEGGAGADRFVIQGFSGPGLQDTIGDFEQSLDKIDLTQAPVFVTAAQLQAQLDANLQSDTDNGFDGGTYLQLGSESNLWISHDDNVSQLTLADFVLNDAGTGIEITGTTGNDTYIDDNNDTSLRGTEADDTINGLDGDDNIEGFGGDDILNGDAGNDNISAGAGSDQINGGAGQDNVNYDSWQFLASRGVQVNLTDTNVDVGDAILLQGEARDPDGGIDELDSIENFNGTQYDDQYWVGSIADTNISADPNDPNYFGVGISGGLGNDSVYQEWDSDVRVFFAPGLSNIGFEGDDGTAGDYFFTNGSGHLEFGDLPNYPGNEGQGVSVGFAYAELDEFGNVVSQQLNQADGPGMRTFFDDGVDYLGLTENSDSVFGNNTATTYFDLRAGADEAYTGGADRGINMGDDGSGGDGAADVVYHQGGNINIDSFELGLDQVDFTQFPTFISSDLLQAQLDQMIVDGQGEIYFDFGQFGSLYLPINPSDFVIADNFILNDPGPGVELDGTAGNDTYIDDNNDTSLRGTEGDDIINGLAGDDNIDGFGGSDVLNGDEGDDNISAGAGNDTINGGAGLDNVNYDSWQFISQRGVTVNLGSGQFGDTQAGEALDPDGGIDTLTGIEGISGSQFGDAVQVGNGADTGMEAPSWFGGNYYFDFSGQAGNDYLESVGDVYVNFTPGESELFYDEFGNDLEPDAGDRVYGNGTGNLNMAEWQFSDQESGVQIYFGFEGQEGQAYGPNVRVFFNGITDANGGKNDDEIYGNEENNSLSGEDGNDIIEGLEGSDYLVGGNGSDTFIFDANSGDDTIGDFNSSEDSLQLFDSLEITSATLVAAEEDGLVNDTLLNIDNGADFVTVTLLDVELTANDIMLI